MSTDDMKGDMFQHELSKTSSVFGRKKDIRVVFQGEDAMTNGSTIVLPSLVQDEDVGMESQLIMRGYVDHEAGHVKHTNHTAVKKLQAEGDEMVSHLANAIEDVWLERRVIDEYEGAQKNLNAVFQAVSQGCLDSHDDDDELWKQDKNVAPVAITWVGRKDYGCEAAEKCLAKINPDLKKAIEGWVTAIDASKGTNDNIAIAKVIANELRDESYKDEEEEHGGHGDGEEEHIEGEHGGGGGDEGEGGRGGKGDEETKGEGEGDDGGGSSRPRGTREVEGEAKDLSEEEFKPMEADMARAMQERLHKDGLTVSGEKSYRALTTAHDKFHHRTDASDKYIFNGGNELRRGEAIDYDQRVQNTAGYINVMRRKLERAILSRANRDWETGKENGRIDSKRLVGAVAGRTDVFKDRLNMPEMDTALSVLIDLSGSMYGDAAYVARDCAIAIVESLDRTGVAYEILGFNSRSRQEAKLAPRVKDESTDKHWSRFEPIDIWEFKRFKDRLFEAKGSLSRIDHCVGGNNVDGESVLYAYNRLKKRPEKRKILMVLSDGQPAANSDFRDHLRRHLRETVKVVGDSGVECVGVGILSDAVRFYYPTYVVVDSLEDLATNVMDQLAKALMGKRFHVNNADLLNVG